MRYLARSGVGEFEMVLGIYTQPRTAFQGLLGRSNTLTTQAYELTKSRKKLLAARQALKGRYIIARVVRPGYGAHL